MSSSPPPQPAPPTAPPPLTRQDESSPRPDWPLWIAPAAIALGFAIGIFVSIFVLAIGGVSGSRLSHPTPAVSLISDVLFDLSFVGAAIYFAGLRGRPGPKDFGFRRVRPRRAIAAVLAAGISYYVLSAVYASIFHLNGHEKLPNELGVSRSTASLVAASVFVCVIAPIAEEFFFRGFIFGVLRQWHVRVAGRDVGTWIAAVITGILFGLAHTGSASARYLVPLGFLGFVLCIVRWRTGSLYPCMALHSINNSLALGINQLHWNAGEIIALMAGAVTVIAVVTAPLSGRSRAPA
jgi:membrane protease YdiL (CAAX protease family)